tara:strand:- start:1273 stop:1764 length:492 start_codon:yes stop_codon:yes gene_type:complete
MESVNKECDFFVFSSKEDYKIMVSVMLNEIKKKIVFTEILNKLLLYDGIASVYKFLNIQDTLLFHINKITKNKQIEWTNDVCWNIYKNTCVSFDSIPFSILKIFTLHNLENFLFKIICNSLSSIDHEGYLDFIEERNIYLIEDSDLIEEINDEILIDEILNND